MSDNGTIEGTVKFFRADKGYGFIQGPDGLEAFVHHSEIKMDGYRTLDAGQRVRFTLEETAKGVSARGVEVIG